MNDEDIKHIIDLLHFSNGKYDTKKIFQDVVSLETYFINAFLIGKKEYAEEFDKLMGFYTLKEQQQMWEILLELAVLYQKQKEANDILGEIYNRLQLHNQRLGQFFTPTHISDLIAKINGIDEEKLKESGYITLHEPCSRCWWYDISLCKRDKSKRV